MSAVNIIVRPDRALVFTDAANYDGSGRLVMIRDKAEIASFGGLVVTGRGNAFFPKLVAATLDGPGWSIDEVEEDGGEIIELAFQRAKPLMDRAGASWNDIFVVGWSEKAKCPKLAIWTNCPPSDMPRFSMREEALAPGLSDAGWARIRRMLGPMTREAMDPERVGLETMKAQRFETGSAEFGCEGQYLVGGHIQQTEVTASGIHKTIVHRWTEDCVGQRIRPVPDIDPDEHPNAVPLEGMNRAARRRANKLHRQRVA